MIEQSSVRTSTPSANMAAGVENRVQRPVLYTEKLSLRLLRPLFGSLHLANFIFGFLLETLAHRQNSISDGDGGTSSIGPK